MPRVRFPCLDLAAGPVSRILSAALSSRECPIHSRCSNVWDRQEQRAAGRSFLWAAHYCTALATYPEVVARRAGTHAKSDSCEPGWRSSPIWSCSVWGLPCHRHYWRRGALLPHLFTLTGSTSQCEARGGMFSVALAVNGRFETPPPGRYPAHCSVEFGLSSADLRPQRPSGPVPWTKGRRSNSS